MTNMEDAIRKNLTTLESDFLDATQCRDESRIQSVFDRFLTLHQQFETAGDKLPADLHKEMHAIAKSMKLMAQAFESVQSLLKTLRRSFLEPSPEMAPNYEGMSDPAGSGEDKESRYSMHAIGSRFILSHLHYPYPSPRSLEKMAQHLSCGVSELKTWFHSKRSAINYLSLLNDFCDGDKRIMRDYLHRTLVTPNASNPVPAEMEAAILDLKARAHSILRVPIEVSKSFNALPHDAPLPKDSSPAPTASRKRKERTIDSETRVVPNEKACSNRVMKKARRQCPTPPLTDGESAGSISPDQSFTLSFTEPVTPNSISRISSSQLKRKRSEDPQADEPLNKLPRLGNPPSCLSPAETQLPVTSAASLALDPPVYDDYPFDFNPNPAAFEGSPTFDPNGPFDLVAPDAQLGPLEGLSVDQSWYTNYLPPMQSPTWSSAMGHGNQTNLQIVNHDDPTDFMASFINEQGPATLEPVAKMPQVDLALPPSLNFDPYSFDFSNFIPTTTPPPSEDTETKIKQLEEEIARLKQSRSQPPQPASLVV